MQQDKQKFKDNRLVYLNGRNAAEGKRDVQLCLRQFNGSSCVELKGDFKRSCGPLLDLSREERKRYVVFTVTSSNSKIKFARSSEFLCNGG